MDLNLFAKEIHQQNVKVGWWDNPDQCIYEKLQLVSTEIAEATEGERKNLMDDHLPHRKMGEVELADALIRILDIGEYLQLTYSKFTHSPRFEFINSIAGHHFILNADLAMLGQSIYFEYEKDILGTEYSQLIDSILYVGQSQGYDVVQAAIEKHDYNKTRADHKRENRAKEGGKAF